MVQFMTNGTAVIQIGRTAVCIEEEGQHCNREKLLASIQYFTNQNIFFLLYEFLNTLKQITLGHDLK